MHAGFLAKHPREVTCGHPWERGLPARESWCDPAPCRGREARVPRNLGGAAGAQAGFTLLELVVVLALLALVAGLAVPNLERLYAGAVRSTERAYILDQFAGLGRRAMQRSRAFVVVGSGDASRPAAGEADEPGPARRRPAGFALPPAARPERAANVIDVPDGWEVSFDEPLVVRANGVCLGAELTLRHLGAVDVRVRLEPPFCRVDADA